MPAAGLRVLYADKMLDGGPVPLLPGGRPAPRSGAGGGDHRRRPAPGFQDLPRLRRGRSPGRAAGVLLPAVRPRRPPETKAGTHEEKTGLDCGQLGPVKPAWQKVFRGPFRGGPYLSTSRPGLPRYCPHLLRGGKPWKMNIIR